jgi:hypothetical protein
MKIIIPKNWHLAINQFTRPMFNGEGYIEKNITFTDTCRYNIGDKQSSWNKLYGQSWGFFPLLTQFQQHFNSSRFGWRYNSLTDKIEITPYWYENSIRHYAETDNLEIASLEIGKEYNFSITAFKSVVIYKIKGVNKWFINQEVPSLKGWIAPLYFGGDKKAPHDIEILMDK